MRRTQIQLSEDLYQLLRRRAFRQGTSLAETIRRLLREGLRLPSPAACPDRRSFTFVASGRSRQGRLVPVSERHDEALAEDGG